MRNFVLLQLNDFYPETYQFQELWNFIADLKDDESEFLSWLDPYLELLANFHTTNNEILEIDTLHSIICDICKNPVFDVGISKKKNLTIFNIIPASAKNAVARINFTDGTHAYVPSTISGFSLVKKEKK